MSRRELRAFLLAPAAAPLGYWLALVACGMARIGGMRPPGLGPAAVALGVALAVGLPVSYVATLLGALPLYAALRRTGRVGRLSLWLVGAAVGLVTSLLVAPRLRGELFSILLPPPAGVALGLLVAEVFWRLCRDTPSGEARAGAGR